MEFLPFQGQVDLTHPDVTLRVCEDYGPLPNALPTEPQMVYFGRHVTDGQRHLAAHYAVRERHFIANTSMDAQLSLIMANQAKVVCVCACVRACVRACVHVCMCVYMCVYMCAGECWELGL